MGTTLQVRLPAPPTAEQVRRRCRWLEAQLRSGAVTAVVCAADRGAADLATVEAVARLALVARRAGVAFHLEAPGTQLSSLLELLGLQAALLPLADDA